MQTKSPSMITITEKAAEKIKTLLEQKEESLESSGLRITVSGGGCSGFMCHMELTHMRDDDNVFTHEEIGSRVFVDAKSLLLLGGSIVDYSEALTDAGFKVKNPNATDSCGCGLSFSV